MTFSSAAAPVKLWNKNFVLWWLEHLTKRRNVFLASGASAKH
ncbi:hypothetical protein [Deinococcus wulumuqiensis]|nr:hypothetical protein [Deinococcus wulumuqiensis]